jgi:uncharacterized protein (TIGR02680 family)
MSERWRPSRAGIRNIWEYDDQLFEFAGGRLVLRGPNGSGKSNALALLVPFLLDGVMAASRMDSLSGGRSMKTLLLCLADDESSARFRHEQRTGYAWLELERVDEHVVIGCGARASTQRDAEAWFFVTDRRPGIDLDLAPGGVPLSRGALIEQLGAGAVHDSAEAYRTAVDRALFGLGAHRYRNLLELLLVLRRPHLAGKLNLEHLSKVLSDGLAGLDEQLITDVAASFEDLEAVQRDLRRLQEAHRTVDSFLPVYRRYLRAVARQRATAAAEAERALLAANRRLSEAGRALARADDDIEMLRRERVAADEEAEVLRQRQRAVLESPAYRDASSLVEVEGRLRDATDQLERADGRLSTAAAEADEAATALSAAEGAMARAATEADQAYRAAAESADAAGVAWSVGREDLAAGDLRPVVHGMTTRRRQDIADVRKALRAADEAATRARSTSDAADAADTQAEQDEAARDDSAAALEEARTSLADELHRWADATELPELESIADLAGTLGEPGAPMLADALAEALRERRDDLAARDALAVDRAEDLDQQHADLVEQRRRIAEDPVPAPDRLATRPADRAGRRGAPLYACCDFADYVAPHDRAGLEAALDAAGLLDAWVGEPTGDLDGWVRATEPFGGPSLAEVLVATPPDGSDIEAADVQAILASIALADAGVAVLVDGRYRLGPLVGRHEKPQAEFIGATAREARRRRLLAELDDRIRDVEAAIAAVANERRAILAERARLDDVAAVMPSPREVLEARDALVSAIATARTSRAAAERAAATAREASSVALAALDRLRTVASERRLPADADGLHDADARLAAFENEAAGLVQAAGTLVASRIEHNRASERASRARADVNVRQGEYDEQHRHVRGLHARVEELRAHLGPDAEAPLRELESIEEDLRRLGREAEGRRAATTEADQARGAAVQAQADANAAVEERTAEVASAAARLEVLRRDDVWSVVAPDDVPPDAAPELAAAVLEATADLRAEADENALQRAYRQLLDELGRGYDPGLSYVDHVGVVEVTSDAGTFSVLWLAEELASQVARQAELLSERDREIFERHLLTRVSEALRELLNDAEELIERINRSLADRPTASGKSVQLRWEVDSADAAVRSALALLRRTPELLGPDERESLRRFFSTAIAQRRAEDAASSYAEILRQVLDYRSWHAFVPHVRSAGGGVQRLTRTLFRSLSGGEQAVVLHLPLFAAAAAHYDAADERAPRLIALDEAFAGIDEGMRAELMGLLVRFDLDVLLTGHELWGAYDEVPELMVYDLLRQPPLEGVSAFAVRWDGATMVEA